MFQRSLIFICSRFLSSIQAASSFFARSPFGYVRSIRKLPSIRTWPSASVIGQYLNHSEHKLFLNLSINIWKAKDSFCQQMGCLNCLLSLCKNHAEIINIFSSIYFNYLENINIYRLEKYEMNITIFVTFLTHWEIQVTRKLQEKIYSWCRFIFYA